MKWVLLAGGLLVATVGLVALVGSLLPKDHVAARKARLPRPPADVFAVIQDVARAAEWRADLKRVETLEPVAGRRRFRELSSQGAITFEVMEEVAPVRLVTRIADEDLPFGGSWTFELQTNGAGTLVTITERGFVKNVIFRALARYVFTHHRTLEQYLRALGRRFGLDVTPEPA
jgi:uncharacterized protein YndB with AHSA1/START domain